LRRLLALGGGWFLLLAGILITPLPLPIGLLMLVLGLAVLVRRSRLVRRRIRDLRTRYPEFSERLRRLEPKVHTTIARTLRQTDPAKRRR
jgi:hypothetical protein